MTFRDGESLARYGKHQRRRAQEAEARRDELAAVVSMQNRILIGVWLRGVLADPADFFRFVEVGEVTSPAGAIVWTALDEAVQRLLRDHPHLAAPAENPWGPAISAVDWYATGVGETEMVATPTVRTSQGGNREVRQHVGRGRIDTQEVLP